MVVWQCSMLPRRRRQRLYRQDRENWSPARKPSLPPLHNLPMANTVTSSHHAQWTVKDMRLGAYDTKVSSTMCEDLDANNRMWRI
jgi:hypothetical protein